MKANKNSFLIHGIINNVLHLPVLIATSIWSMLIIGIFNPDNPSYLLWKILF